MKGVRFWGTRGSLPVALTAAGLRGKLKGVLRAAHGKALDSDAAIDSLLDSLPFAAGRHLWRPQFVCADRHRRAASYIVCDMGSGLRAFGQAAMAQRGGKAQTFHILMSHLHWDHIMGLPFFVPGFIPGNRVIIYGSHREIEIGAAPPAGAAVLPGGFRHHLRRPAMEFVHLEPGVSARGRGRAA